MAIVGKPQMKKGELTKWKITKEEVEEAFEAQEVVFEEDNKISQRHT